MIPFFPLASETTLWSGTELAGALLLGPGAEALVALLRSAPPEAGAQVPLGAAGAERNAATASHEAASPPPQPPNFLQQIFRAPAPCLG